MSDEMLDQVVADLERTRLFTDDELAVLRASDRVVDQQEPGGVLDRLDRDANRIVRDMKRARGAA